MPGLGSEEWLLPTTGGVPLQIRMKYLDDARRIRDLDDFTSEHDSIVNRKDAIAAFVEQFQNIDERWHNSLDPTTVDIIKACVTIQCSILEDDGRTWCLLADSNTVIATALWTLAMARQITEVEGTVTTVSVRKFCENKSLEPDIEEWDGLVLEISRAETEAGQTKPKESKLPALVAEIHRITLKMFLQRRLQDLPVILCVLCLMRLILTCFHGACFYHPLVKNWDKSAYEEALGEENAISVSYFEILHVAWIESGFEHHCNTEPLASRLEAFVFADLFFLKEDSD
ncbi:uncharacterized protein LY89DRAFT_209690 [Mollisia scopiformis]|uniref:Uncharacterized protein n=1 Tax=Mollisia scopiformis TaxID=149040 RepID=A0A194WXW9_MOLSC|nr:uncharacterized protein LY89DRAFT_209690 [Mollisia scopiformis]KUJ12539.1 hypothetical protein LY89DRAFT_209690 [Mollisia scopiformis]